MVSAIILDFDGVILESVSVKTEAFRALFSFSPDHMDEIVQFHIENGGMSRFDKVRHIYTEILKESLPQEKFGALSRRFSELVEDAVARAPFVDGTPEFLAYASEQFPLYIVSATPEDELKRIVIQRDINRFFREICGSPVKKKDHITRIMAENRLDSSSVLFVGDAINDWEAARQCGIRFIGRTMPGDPDRFLNLPGVEKKIANLRDLKEYLETLPC
ncbi:HAD family hydrolase [Methanoregula sp.]|uniref:HAD family hydrolase n=1 Tax=Methanoregula sp. TaxID=2052170 RepID=UPI000CB354FD|nr:HAD-IA family hydrolase [Methanoregula sp.]PKG32893.1 MAG: HAD family hydrolase [Methanoregula sp.]